MTTSSSDVADEEQFFFTQVDKNDEYCTRNSQSQNTLDPEMAQEHISQVSEEIEGRVTKKLSEEFSRTESRILGALSKLDEFLLNPQVQTCYAAVLEHPGTATQKTGNPLGIVP